MSFSAVQRIWRKHGVRPHRLDTHMVSNDPDFETKAADGLYLNPPAHVAVITSRWSPEASSFRPMIPNH